MIADREKRIVFIVGPTGVGKSAVAIDLAQQINGSIISCDAMQVYDHIRIASNRPSPIEEQSIKHHLTGCVPIEADFDVSRFYKLALGAIEEIREAKKIPVVCGGSGMYAQILLDGIFEESGKDDVLRQELFGLAQEKGLDALYQMLVEKDPDAAKKIHPHDLKRIVRGLEVGIKEKKPISQLQKQRSGLWDQYAIKIFGLRMEREALYDRINRRVDQMLKDGLVEEISALKNISLSSTAEKIIGVQEIRKYLSGQCSLEQAAEEMKQNTRRYAKRQMTWFRKEKRIEWIDLENNYNVEKVGEKIYAAWELVL
ncbi:MAG: tRNA (adenosine(37)-N6)-dimethylallyltransferase MiaA [Candidatus Omnitrophica bacterium]|nr:tRNA (adenosine(37)-N6)-dimethylallyltransferase MiaA [Candidatus Omnitrophota bacterium]